MLARWASQGRTRRGAPDRTRPEPDDIVEFDERWYLESYPDVARSVAQGHYESGRHHYLAHGLREGRKGRGSSDARDPEGALPDMRRRHQAALYLTPQDLGVKPFELRRTLVIGSCLAETWANHPDLSMAHQPDLLLVSRHGAMPATLPHPASDYDAFVVQLPLRDLLPDNRLWRLPYHDADGHRAAFEEARSGVDHYVEKICTWAEAFGAPVLFGNFLLPQADLAGRLLPRYDLRNGLHFIEELNRALEASLGRFASAHLLDVDRIAASFGRRHIQDDAVLWAMHGSLMPTEWEARPRTEPMAPIEEHYEITWPASFVAALWAEATAMVKTLAQAEMVKLVVVDLDDTLWSGISGDEADIDPMMIEGWPLGVAEALMFLKKRGVLLAIISKNDEERIRSIWPTIFRGQVTLDDFAAVRINWDRKPGNMSEILRALNLLPDNTVFIDDNPVERAEMRHAFPTMRVLGRYPFYLRRTLLWAPETQVAAISSESAGRTQSMHAKAERDAAGRDLDRAVFLRSLGLKVRTSEIGLEDARFPRALELLNKTNQFNTTGRRWTQAELRAASAMGTRLFVFDAEDRFAAYGLVGVCLAAGATVMQFVMSCRVNGLDVEVAALADIVAAIRPAGGGSVSAHLVETRLNLLCRDFWERSGFTPADGCWTLPSGKDLRRPVHVV